MAEAKAKTTKKTVAKKAVAKKVTAPKAVEKKVEKKEEVALNPSVWQVKYNEDLVAQVLYVQQSNARLGTAKAKTRAEVRGGGRKPWKQKGTGRARHGSIRSPLWRKGGVTFPPSDRVWDMKINKKMVKKAICIMLSERLRNNSLEFVNISKKDLKGTRSVLVDQLGKANSLVITDNADVKMAVSNVKSINHATANNFSVVNLVKAKKILVDNSVVKMIEDRLVNEK